MAGKTHTIARTNFFINAQYVRRWPWRAILIWLTAIDAVAIHAYRADKLRAIAGAPALPPRDMQTAVLGKFADGAAGIAGALICLLWQR